MLDSARARGVAGFLNISTRQREWGDVIAVAERHDDVWATVGVHPHEADAHPDLGAAALVEGAQHPRVIAIGECGLDYYYDKSDRAAQRERFEAHIDAARQTGLPLVIHTRDAEEDTGEILRSGRRAGGRHRRAPLLHRIGGPGAQGARPRFLHLAVGDRDLQECRGPAGNRQMATGRPDAGRNGFARSSRPSPTAARRASRRSSPTPRPLSPSLRGEPLETLAEATTANFFRLFTRALQ